MLYGLSEIEKWLVNAQAPDTLYVKSIKEGKITIISVSFETRGKNGCFFNKEIKINDKVILDMQDIRDEIYQKCTVIDDCVYILAVTEYNDPKLFDRMIKK